MAFRGAFLVCVMCLWCAADARRRCLVYLYITADGLLPSDLATVLPAKSPCIDVIVGWFLSRPENSSLILVDIRGTSVFESRNMLLDYALRSESRLSYKYEYFIFSDGDIVLDLQPSRASKISRRRCDSKGNSARRPYDYFECMLFVYRAAVAAPYIVTWTADSRIGEDVAAVSTVDDATVAFHRLALPVLLPFVTTYDAQSWHIGHSIWYIRATCVYGSVLTFYRLRQARDFPNKHRAYPKGENALESALANARAYLHFSVVPHASVHKPSYLVSSSPVPRADWLSVIPEACFWEPTPFSFEHKGFRFSNWSVALSPGGRENRSLQLQQRVPAQWHSGAPSMGDAFYKILAYILFCSVFFVVAYLTREAGVYNGSVLILALFNQ